MDDPRLGTYTELPFPAIRTLVSDTVRLGMARPRIPVLIEVDVTDARAAIEKRKAAMGEELSFTGWIIKCLAQAVSEHPRVHALRRGWRRLVLFSDVDVGYMVGRRPGGAGRSPDVPMPGLVRKANEKSVETITAEIRAAQGRGPAPAERAIEPPQWVPSRRMMRIFASLPFFVRKVLYWDRLLRDPSRMKRQMGTVAVTAVGMFAKIGSGSNWGIPIEFHPLTVGLGAIARKPAVVGDTVVPREFLGMTLMFDHDVIDGAPMAGFLQRLRELIESGYGLDGDWAPTAVDTEPATVGTWACTGPDNPAGGCL
jgi:pyruvate/2-oxoglutarate dehydrogenase complex dihydrolipoamide acyltransferase (E2) component